MNEIPLLYHAHHSLHDDDLAFWLDLAARLPGPILELGCGAGRVLIPLLGSGRTVVGLDRDPDMLALLKTNLPPALGSAPLILLADFARFRLAYTFGLILMPCNTYSTLSVAQRQSVLTCVRQHLREGGIFAVSLPNPDWLLSLPARSPAQLEEVFPHPLDGEPVQVSSGWRRARRRERYEFILDWHYDHLKSDGTVSRLTIQTRHDLTPAALYLEQIRSAGFERVQSFGSFDRSVFMADSPEWIILAG